MEVTKELRVAWGKRVVTLRASDLEVCFFEGSHGTEMVNIEVADGKAYSTLTLPEFCQLLAEIRKEISQRHWTTPNLTNEQQPPPTTK